MCSILEVAYSKIKGDAECRPYVDIVIVTPNGESAPIKALVDSGACITWIPEEVLKPLSPYCKSLPIRIRTPLVKMKKIRPFIVHILIQNNGEYWSGVRPWRGVLATDINFAYLGRDVLNDFIVTLDGETVRLERKD